MGFDITDYAKGRYTAKAYDPGRKIPDEDIEKIKELLRYSPSSVNGQPWHFILASSEGAREKIARSTDALYSFNSPLIRNASHVVVFCGRLDMEEDFLKKLLAQEEKDGRFDADPSLKEKMNAGRSRFVALHKEERKDVKYWTARQVYLNLGAFLLGVSTMGIAATRMEGIDTQVLDEEFGLREKGYAALVVVALGYSDPEKDYNAKLPKSRLPCSDILTEV